MKKIAYIFGTGIWIALSIIKIFGDIIEFYFDEYFREINETIKWRINTNQKYGYDLFQANEYDPWS